MKKILLTVTAFLSIQLAMAQAPQGLNYQAVVFSSNGTALSNQLVSLRLSVLDSSANGTAVYVETQTPTTDTTGLFSVVIGNGTVVSGTFSTINWGKNYKFLKTEIDTLGGTNYVTMGVTQFMSVPYALYANKTKPDYVTTNIPDGMNNMIPVLLDTLSYTVPTGKNLYVPFTALRLLHGTDTLMGYTAANTYFGFNEGETITLQWDSTFAVWNYGATQCFLVDKTVDWITRDIILNPITVPLGKIFVAVYYSSNPNSFYDNNYTSYWPNLFLNGQILQGNIYNGIILFPGQTLSAQLTGYPGQLIVNGYFRDE